ncbi:MAG: hypothetical protein Q9208_006691 [Pyrenodesmia sp. 3 TL-2023]
MSQFYQQQTPYPTPSLTSLRPPPRAILRPSTSSTSDLTIRPSTATLRAPITHRKHSASTLQAGPNPSASRKPSTATLRSPDASTSRKPSTSTLRSGGPASSTTTTTTNPPPTNKLTKRTSTPTLTHTRSTASLRHHPHPHPHPRPRKPHSPTPSISAPAPPTKLLRLSELLDPADLLRSEQAGDIGEGRVITGEGRRVMVQSPSGQQLDAEAYARRPDRPLTVQERQARIREETIRKGEEARRAELRRVTAKKERGCCGVM